MPDDRWHKAARMITAATRGSRRDLNALRQASEDCLAAILDQHAEADPRAAHLAALGREAALERRLVAAEAERDALKAENATLKSQKP